jgi:hypothetical protein
MLCKVTLGHLKNVDCTARKELGYLDLTQSTKKEIKNQGKVQISLRSLWKWISKLVLDIKPHFPAFALPFTFYSSRFCY